VIAGITVGLVALPLAMAFSIALGIDPAGRDLLRDGDGLSNFCPRPGPKHKSAGQRGLLLLSCRHCRRTWRGRLFMCTVMAGILLVVMGATGWGQEVKFIPRPVVIGFTNGIAVLIASTQVKDFFGLHLEKVPGVFLATNEGARRQLSNLVTDGDHPRRRHRCHHAVCRILSKRIPDRLLPCWEPPPRLLY